jgi:hypothetical protein
MTTAPKILTATVRRKDIERSSILAGRYVWRGPASDPVFAFENCRDFRLDNIDVVCETPTIAAFLMERTKTGPGVIPSTMHTLSNVRIFGNGLANIGIYYRATIDENNEHGRFDCVSVYGCRLAAWSFSGQQSKEHLLTHCRTESCDVGVVSESAFQWIGGTCAVAECGIYLPRAGDPVTVQGVGFEACQRVLITSGPTTAAQPVTLINCRYEADQLAPDNEMIVMKHAGPLVLLGGRYGGGKQRIPRIALRGTGNQYVEFVGRPHFGSYGAYKVNPVIGQNPPEAIVTGSYLAQRDENDPQNTQRVDTVTVDRITV